MKHKGGKLQRTGEVDAFLRKVAETPAPMVATGAGRLMFAMDATASREPAWDRACRIQSEMFAATATLGGLNVQLCYYRGFNEFHATPWLNRADELIERMNGVRCAGGVTQISRVLKHTKRENEKRRVNALVFVGDCMEEDVDTLCGLAGKLGLAGVPVFVFHEGGEPIAGQAFREVARLSKGAYCHFDANSAEQLRDLLAAVAVYAAGGRQALEDFGVRRGGAAKRLTMQISKN
jgi:hypothetical protein